MLIYGISSFIYYFTFNRFIIYIFHCYIGFIKIFLYFYFPIWVNQFDIKKWKITMMTVFNITTPLCQTIENFIPTINESNNWYLNYMILGIIIISFCILLLFIHSKYFSANFIFCWL